MPIYDVHFTQTISTTVTVEADSPDEAIDQAYQSSDMPGSMGHGAFGHGVTVDSSGEWEPLDVTDERDKVVWPLPEKSADA